MLRITSALLSYSSQPAQALPCDTWWLFPFSSSPLLAIVAKRLQLSPGRGKRSTLWCRQARQHGAGEVRTLVGRWRSHESPRCCGEEPACSQRSSFRFRPTRSCEDPSKKGWRPAPWNGTISGKWNSRSSVPGQGKRRPSLSPCHVQPLLAAGGARGGGSRAAPALAPPPPFPAPVIPHHHEDVDIVFLRRDSHTRWERCGRCREGHSSCWARCPKRGEEAPRRNTDKVAACRGCTRLSMASLAKVLRIGIAVMPLRRRPQRPFPLRICLQESLYKATPSENGSNPRHKICTRLLDKT